MVTLHDYQKPHAARLVQSLLANDMAHDGSDAGTGKTYTAAGVILTLNCRALIIAPLSVVPTWNEVLDAFGITTATVTNYEKAWRHFGSVKPWGNGSFFQFNEKWDLIIFDEVHRSGGTTTVNAKMLIAAKRSGARILTLSATAADTPIRMKAFGFVLGLHNNKDYLDWLLKCNAKPGQFGGWRWNPKENQNVMHCMHEMIYGGPGYVGVPKGYRMRIADIPNFPTTIKEVRLIPCVDTQVNRLSKELKAFYDERTVKGYQSEHDLAQLTYFRQALETAKIPAIVDMIEDALETSRVVVFTNFNVTIDELIRIATKKGWTYGFVRGEQSASAAGLKQRADMIASFQRNELDIIFSNMQAGGVGVSYHDPVTQVPRTQIILPTFSSVLLTQALGRSRRDGGGFSRNFLVYFEKGLEAAIAKIVRTKLDSLHLLNDAELCGDFKRSTAHLTGDDQM